MSKKLPLSLIFLAILGLLRLHAQVIPNLGFETWSQDIFVPSANNPNSGNGTNGWWDLNYTNDSLFGSSPITVYEGSANPAPESGSHYAEIVSKTMTPLTFDQQKLHGFTYPRTNGIMYLGYRYFDIVHLTGTNIAGIPCAGKLDSLSFYYRYIPNGSDSCYCSIALYHWNSAAKNRTILGGGVWGSPAKKTNWTYTGVLPIYYFPDSINVKPDSVLIVFSACTLDSNNNPKVNDTLDIDGGSITGFFSLAAQYSKVNIYPNPANTEINLAVTSQIQADKVEVYDVTGKLVNSYSLHNNFLTINTEQYSTGLYFYKLMDSKGNQMNTGKFSVIK